MIKDVTALVLFCCTQELIDLSILSFRKFYPDIRLVIIDNSGINGIECTNALKRYCEIDNNTDLFIIGKNLGHGLGLHYGLKQIKTKYVYIFESDVLMEQTGLIEELLKLASNEIYSVGPIMNVFYKNGQLTNIKSKDTMRLSWPYATLISVESYFKYPCWDSDSGINASPLKKAMQAIADSDKEDRLIIEFNSDKYVNHLYGGTRGKIGIPSLKDYKSYEDSII